MRFWRESLPETEEELRGGAASHGWTFNKRFVVFELVPPESLLDKTRKGGTGPNVGSLSASTDRAIIDKLWNRFLAAWCEGKDDPKIALLKFDASDARIWTDASSLIAGIKMFIGIDPKEHYKENVAQVEL